MFHNSRSYSGFNLFNKFYSSYKHLKIRQKNEYLFSLKSIGHRDFPSKSLFAVTFLILCLTFSTMMLGVYLSSIHQGYSCKTWPLCPNGFNFPPEEYFYEHYHRFFVLILSLSLFSFTIYSLAKVRNRNLSVKLSIASILLGSQIILGWAVIATKLQPIIVASHLSTGIALFGILVVTLVSLQHHHYRVIKS